MTIVDIAKESGYSISTVSRVLNNRQDVSPEAKAKIMEIVNAHGFVPNTNAKHLKQVVTKNILVLVKGTSNMLFAQVIERIQMMMETAQYTVNVYYFDEAKNEVQEAINLCRERKPLGIIFLGGNPEFFRAEFSQINVPCVLVSTQGSDLGFENLSSVATDDISAAKKAMDYLFSKGHSNIAVLGGDLQISYTSVQRFMGYELSYKSHGKDFDFTYFEKARYSLEESYSGMSRLLDKDLPMTAVVAMSDVMAIGAIRAIRDHGLSVPDDISIVGFDGTALAEYYNPRLITIRQDHVKMADRSVEILLGMINLRRTASHELIPFSITNGESVKDLND